MEGTLYVTCESALFADKATMYLNLHNLLIVQGWNGNVVIATPNISLENLTKGSLLRRQLRSVAYNHVLYLSVVFYDLERGSEVRLRYWELGDINGRKQTVHIFPAEFFVATNGWKHFFGFAAAQLNLKI